VRRHCRRERRIEVQPARQDAHGPDVIARNYGATAAHGFVYDHREGFVFRWKNHEVRGGVDRWELGLIDEPREIGRAKIYEEWLPPIQAADEEGLPGEDQDAFEGFAFAKACRRSNGCFQG